MVAVTVRLEPRRVPSSPALAPGAAAMIHRVGPFDYLRVGLNLCRQEAPMNDEFGMIVTEVHRDVILHCLPLQIRYHTAPSWRSLTVSWYGRGSPDPTWERRIL